MLHVYPATPKIKLVLLTSGTSWTPPVGCYMIHITRMIGGSGGTGARSNLSSQDNSVCGSSAAECLIDRYLITTPGVALTYSIGAAGTGGASANGDQPGTAGGNTTISNGTTTLTAQGSGGTQSGNNATATGSTPGGNRAGTAAAKSFGAQSKGANAVEFRNTIQGACGGSATSTTTAATAAGAGGDCGEFQGGAGAISDGTNAGGGGGGSSPFGRGGDAGAIGTDNPGSQAAADAYGAGSGGVSGGPSNNIAGTDGRPGAIEFVYWTWSA